MTTNDKRFLLICAVIAGLSLWVGVNYFYKAFPEASIDFVVSQDRAKEIALKFLTDRGADVTTYRSAGMFGYADSVKVFLEKEMGLEQANALMGTKLHLWRWANRWYVPLQKEEYEISVTTRGEVARFAHLIPEERAGETLEKSAARTKAELFLTSVMGWDIAKLDFVEDVAQQRPKRTDYTFTWKEKDWSFRDADHRVSVEIDGADIGAYNDFVHIPETWLRSYRELRAQNNTAGTVDALFMVLLIVGMIAVFIQRIRRRDIRWRAAIIFGGITMILTVLSSLNLFSLIEFRYVTTDSYGSFITKEILGSLAGGVFQGLAIALFTAAAESLYREYMPGAIALPNIFRRRTLRTKSFMISVVLGLTLTCFFLAYQTIFYLAANALGAWAPADVPFDNLLNTKLPWVFVLIGGFFPAVSEEFIFRMFAIPFLQRVFKQRWLAIVLAAFIWGFGHAGYPNEPFYIRGLEVGVAGIIIGVIMLRYGILATLVWHYTVDALYSAVLLMRSGNLYFIGSGALSAGIMLVPLAIAVILYLRHKSFVPEDDLTNAHEGVAPPLPPALDDQSTAEISTYTPLPRKQIIIGLVIAAACCALLLIPTVKIGDAVDFAVTRPEAEAAATRYLQSRGVDPSQWRSVTTEENIVEKYGVRYILEHRDIAALNTVYGRTLQPVLWRTRFYKPLQREEYKILVNVHDGSIYGFTHELADSAAGATLERDSALMIAQRALHDHGIDLQQYELKESKAEEKKARRDHLFTWEAAAASALNVDSAKVRIQSQVAGAEVAQINHLLKLPEDWVREQDTSTVASTVHTWLKVGIGVLMFFYALWLFFKRVRQGTIVWKPSITVAAMLLITGAMTVVNGLGGFFGAYQTTTTIEQFVAVAAIGLAIAGILLGVFTTLAVGLAGSIHPTAFSSWRGSAFRERARDAVVAALIFSCVMIGLQHCESVLTMMFPLTADGASISAPSGISTWMPAVDMLGGSSIMALLGSVILGIAMFIAFRQFPKKYLIPAAIGVALIMFIPDHGTPRDMVIHVLEHTISTLVFLALVKWFFRDNVVAYVVAMFASGVVEFGIVYSGFSAPFFRWNGMIVFILLGVFLVALWVRGNARTIAHD